LGFRVGQLGISFIAIPGLPKTTNNLLLQSLGKILLGKEGEKKTQLKIVLTPWIFRV
jgi:hypothetical protein